MQQVVGARIRAKWSTQAASCIASSGRNGYFSHPAFNQTTCQQGESCFPGTRARSTRERLGDILDVAQQLATPNADATYQANLTLARAASYIVIDSMSGPVLTATFLDDMVAQYDRFINQLTISLNSAFPLAVRTSVMDELCSPRNVEDMAKLQDQCIDNNQFCSLQDLFNTINFCISYQNGAALDANLAQATAVKIGLSNERDRLSTERDQIRSLWNRIQSLRPVSFAGLPASCNVHFQFGTAQLPLSDFIGARPGAELRFLYGDWEWANLGLTSSTVKDLAYVKAIATLTHDCIGDSRYGRLDFRRRSIVAQGETREEPPKEYYTRMLTDLVNIRRQLSDIEVNYTTLIHKHAPRVLDSEINGLKTIVSDTVVRVRELVANRAAGVGWVVVLMQDFMDASERYTAAQQATRGLATVLLHQYPQFRDAVIDMLISNTQSVLDQYGDFFSSARRANLEMLLAEATASGDDDIDQEVATISQIADDMQAEFQAMWDDKEPLGQLASQLKFVFGACQNTPTPHPLLTYFRDLPVAAHIVQKGNDAQFCNP